MQNDKAFETPLIGFSRGDDPLYEAFKEHVGPFCMTPWEIFAITFYGFDGYGCELCQTLVPCESKIPNRKDCT